MRPSLLEQWERQKSASLPKKALSKSITTKVAPSAKRFVSAPKVSKTNYGNETLRPNPGYGMKIEMKKVFIPKKSK